MWSRSDGTEAPQKLFDSPKSIVPWSITADGKGLAYCELAPDMLNDIWTVPLDIRDPAHPKIRKPEISSKHLL